MADPINRPSYTPSPLKPIPWFMRRPITPGMEAFRRASAVDRYLHSPSPLSISLPSGNPTVCPSRSSSSTDHAIPQVSEQLTRRKVPEPEDEECPPSRSTRRQRTFSLVKEEPLIRPSSRLRIREQGSASASEDYTIALEWPQMTLDSVLCASYPSLGEAGDRQGPSYLSRSRDQRPPCVSPGQSTEYIRRYQRPSMSSSVRREELSVNTDSHGNVCKGKSAEKRRGFGSELKRFFTGR